MVQKEPIRCIQGNIATPSDFNVLDELEFLLEKQNKETWSRKVGVYHPSAITGCPRALYYDRIGTEPKQCIPKYLRMLFDMGHAIHDVIQNRLKNIPGFEAEVVAYYEPLNLFGHCDGIFRDEDWVLEIKTVGDSVFKNLVKPKPDHIAQAHCYMWALDIPRCQMLYVHRSTGKLRMFPVFFSDSVWERVVRTIKHIDRCVDEGTPPSKEINSYICKTCKFKHECKPFD